MSDRSYLIAEDARRDEALRPYFDSCVAQVLDGTAQLSKTRAKPGYPQLECFRAEGKEVLFDAILEYYLFRLGVSGFDYEKAFDFTERLRKRFGFGFGVRYPLEQWVNRCLRDPYFDNKSNEKWRADWILKPDETHDSIPEDYFRFACYIAICHLKYGQSFESVTANQIFGFVTALGSDLPKKLKKNGSGTLPKEITEYQDGNLACKANDALAVVKIAMKAEAETSYGKALDFLCALLETDFPRSYAIDFRSPVKNFLPIKGLPKKGVHQLFANAAHYEGLREKIERYARLAMKEYEWYTNLENENCAMPGTFAVFALALRDEKYAPLAVKYLDLCDDEHSGIQGGFIAAFVERFGFGAAGIAVFIAGANSMQELPPNKVYANAAANTESLNRLLEAKAALEEHQWRSALYALWGKDAIYDKGVKTLKAASPELRPLIERLLG